jgi:hypothetical protein
MGGPNTSTATNRQNEIAGLQQQTAQEELQMSKEDRDRRVALQQPAIDKYTAGAAGSRTEALKAAMPTITEISQGYAGAKDSIMGSLPPGAARDLAVAQLERGKYTAQGSAMSQFSNESADKLANIGAGLGSFSLNEAGAALRGLEGSAQTNANIVEQQSAAKATQLGFLGSLAGTGGKVATGWKGSDRRLKDRLQHVPRLVTAEIAEKLVQVTPWRFDYIDGPKDQLGVMAQDLLKAFPEAVSVDERGYLQVDYGMLSVALLQALAIVVERLQMQEV